MDKSKMALGAVSGVSDVALRNIIPIIITFSAVIIGYFSASVEYVTLSVFVLLIVVFSIFRFDPRVIIGYGILMLLITATLTYVNADDNTIEQVAVISYWLLVSGIICIIIDSYRRKKNNQKVMA
jgi:hypothetical protein